LGNDHEQVRTKTTFYTKPEKGYGRLLDSGNIGSSLQQGKRARGKKEWE